MTGPSVESSGARGRERADSVDPNWSARSVALILVVFWAGCSHGASVQRYHPEIVEDELEVGAGEDDVSIVLGVETFSASPAYDEQRMVYRESPYKLSYYHYHRWSTPTGSLVGDFLADVYRRTGEFEAVIPGHNSTVDVVLAGQVAALEEVDAGEKKWLARVEVSLQLRDASTGDLLWTGDVEREVDMPEQSPFGLSRGVSRALTDIGSETARSIRRAAVENRRQRESAGGGDRSEEAGGSAEVAETVR